MLSIIILILILLLPSYTHANSDQMVYESSKDSYINLTVEEAWDYLSNTSNGIQYPIDVRTLSEWEDERIDTPYPEFPIHFPKNDIVDEISYQEFIGKYNGEDVILYCKSGGRSAYCANILITRGFNGTVYNVLGGITDWKLYSYPTKTGNMKPEIPTIVDSPDICNLNQEYNFSVQTTDFNEDPVRFGWDFDGDKIVDEWSEYVISTSISNLVHNYNATGIYQVSVMAQDIVGGTTEFTDSISITINTPPDPPIIHGEIEGKVGTNYDYSIVSTDAECNEISYLVDWGDGTSEGWTRTKPSGEEFITSHQWNNKSEYTIRVKAKDICDAESEWATLDISMPKSQMHFNYRYLFFNSLIEFIFNILGK